MKKYLLTIMLCFLFGCATWQPPQWFFESKPLQTSAFNLVENCLQAQMDNMSPQTIWNEFGNGATIFNDLQSYNCGSYGSEYGKPAVECEIKGTNAFGAALWRNYIFRLSYDPNLKNKYNGFKIEYSHLGTFGQ